tara:strand:- start:173 stop:463 length:291 start_codon:yes stop_codon:yes gene_type:complete
MPRTKLIDGVRINFTAEEETARDAEEKAWRDKAFDRAIEKLREKRNKLLTETDYLGLSDQTLSDDMKTYRQELRDITNGLTTKDEVDAVTFPTKPE